MKKKHFVVDDMFGNGAPKSVKVVGLEKPVRKTPMIEENYVFRNDLLRDVLAWWAFGSKNEGLFLTGPTGSGKSSMITQVMARLNWPVQAVNGHEEMEFSDLVGRPIFKTDGSMDYQYGPLSIAAKYGHLFMIDELDALTPGSSIGLNGIVQGQPLIIPENGGEVIYPHPSFRFAATGNTVGNGDNGFYAGTSRQNEALMDRFWVSHVDYMEPELERKLLASTLQEMNMRLPDKKLNQFIEVANEVRKLFVAEKIANTMSTRVLLRWAKTTQLFYSVVNQGFSPLHYALRRSITYRTDPDTAYAIHEIVQRIFGESEYVDPPKQEEGANG